MKYILKGFCLRTVDEQRSSEDYYNIYPEGVKFANPVPVTLEFGDSIIGYASVNLIDGRLVAEMEIESPSVVNGLNHYAVGVNSQIFHGEVAEAHIRESELYCLALTRENKDKTMPRFEVITEN